MLELVRAPARRDPGTAVGVSDRSAWLIKHKVMQAMRLAEDGRDLDGRIEIDDVYLGDEFSGKAGRGSENRVPFVAAVHRLG